MFIMQISVFLLCKIGGVFTHLLFGHIAPVQSWQDHSWGSPVPALLSLYSGVFSQVKDSVMFLTRESPNY